MIRGSFLSRRHPLVGVLWVVALVGCLAPAWVQAATGQAQTREQQLRILQLKEAELDEKNATNAFEQKEKEVKDLRELYEQDAVTGKEVRQAELELENRQQDLEAARLRLEKTRLKFVEGAIHLELVSARKSVEENGDRKVTVSIRNNSDLEEAMTGQPEGTLRQEVTPFLKVENLYVHLEQGGTIVGYPYQALIKDLPYGKGHDFVFDLKKDVDDLTVVLSYHGREEKLDVYLARSQSGEAKVRLKASQFSQTAGTGTAALHKFGLERLEEAEMILALDGEGLPEGYKLRFLDEARNPVTQVRFLRGVPSLALTAEVSVPENLGQDDLGQKISFFIIAATQDQFESFASQKGQREFTSATLAAQGLAHERLELVPRGVGELELRFESLDITRLDKETFTLEGTLLNTGTAPLRDTRILIDKPTGWESESEPTRLSNVAAGDSAKFIIKTTPAADTALGSYDLKLKARSEEEGVTVESSQKSIRVILEAEANTRAIGFLGFMALLLVVGIMIYTVRLSKK